MKLFNSVHSGHCLICVPLQSPLSGSRFLRSMRGHPGLRATCQWHVRTYERVEIGFTKGMGSNVQVFKIYNGEYGGADEPQKPQNFVRPSE